MYLPPCTSTVPEESLTFCNTQLIVPNYVTYMEQECIHLLPITFVLSLDNPANICIYKHILTHSHSCTRTCNIHSIRQLFNFLWLGLRWEKKLFSNLGNLLCKTGSQSWVVVLLLTLEGYWLVLDTLHFSLLKNETHQIIYALSLGHITSSRMSWRDTVYFPM